MLDNVFQVEGAKVVTNAKSPGSRCYGLVTMGSADEASKCIQYLHRTELSGRMISVERVSLQAYQYYLVAFQILAHPAPLLSSNFKHFLHRLTTNMETISTFLTFLLAYPCLFVTTPNYLFFPQQFDQSRRVNKVMRFPLYNFQFKNPL